MVIYPDPRIVMSVPENTSVPGWAWRQYLAVRESFRDVRDRLKHERSVYIMAGLGLALLSLGVAVFLVERANMPAGDHSNWIDTIGHALYWMFVTGTTTGYGDYYPHTGVGRALTVLFLVGSMVLTSIMTATIASYFVERRLMEGKGMEKVSWRGHTVICGWNVNGRDLLEGIYRETRDSAQVVMVNNLPEEEVSELLYQFARQGLRFVRGDFVHESVLGRANCALAATVVILADGVIHNGFAGADERTVLCALAAKSMSPTVKVCAELVDEKNQGHLRRAQVDHVVVLGEHDDYLLSKAVAAPGVAVAFQEILNPVRGPYIHQARIPAQLVDQDFAALHRYFREKRGALVIGVVSEEERGMNLEDILSDDMSAIDQFIKRQFEGMEGDYFHKSGSIKLKINPPDSYKIQKNDVALIITSESSGNP